MPYHESSGTGLKRCDVTGEIVYSSGKLTIGDMVKAGFWLMLAGIALTVVFVSLFAT